MKSSPENPFLFVVDEDVVALKNNKRIGDHGFYDAPKVTQWYQRREYDLPLQMPQHEVLAPKALLYVRFEMYCKNAMTRGDLDNAYTSMQEFLQLPDPNGKEKGILGVVSDDKYVQGFSAVRLPYEGRFLMNMALLWCWEFVEGVDDIVQLGVFRLNRQRNLDQRYKKQTSGLAAFDF